MILGAMENLLLISAMALVTLIAFSFTLSPPPADSNPTSPTGISSQFTPDAIIFKSTLSAGSASHIKGA